MASLASLTRRVSRALVREDIDPEEMLAWVASATTRLNEELRISDMLVRATLPLSSNLITPPPDFLAIKSIRVLSTATGAAQGPLIYATPDDIGTMAARMPANAPGYFTSYGRQIEIAPFRNYSGSTLEMRYYGSIKELLEEDDTNFALERYPDLYLNAALIFGFRFYLEFDASLMRDGLVSQEIQRLNDRDTMAKYGEGPLVMRPARRIGGRYS